MELELDLWAQLKLRHQLERELSQELRSELDSEPSAELRCEQEGELEFQKARWELASCFYMRERRSLMSDSDIYTTGNETDKAASAGL